MKMNAIQYPKISNSILPTPIISNRDIKKSDHTLDSTQSPYNSSESMSLGPFNSDQLGYNLASMEGGIKVERRALHEPI